MKKLLIVLFLLALMGFGCTAVISYQTIEGGGSNAVNVSPNQPLDVGVQVNPSPATQPKE